MIVVALRNAVISSASFLGEIGEDQARVIPEIVRGLVRVGVLWALNVAFYDCL